MANYVKSTDTQAVRSRGYLWLNHIAMSVVNCSRAEMVVFSGLKPSWSGAGRIYLLNHQSSQDFRSWTEKRDGPI